MTITVRRPTPIDLSAPLAAGPYLDPASPSQTTTRVSLEEPPFRVQEWETYIPESVLYGGGGGAGGLGSGGGVGVAGQLQPSGIYTQINHTTINTGSAPTPFELSQTASWPSTQPQEYVELRGPGGRVWGALRLTSGGRLEFEGNIGESARAFVQTVESMFGQNDRDQRRKAKRELEAQYTVDYYKYTQRILTVCRDYAVQLGPGKEQATILDLISRIEQMPQEEPNEGSY